MSDFAPVVLFVVMLLMFISTGYLQREYYNNVFTDALESTDFIALLIPIVIQTLRLVTGFLSASFFKKRRFLMGVFVFLFSLWLTGFEHREAMHMGDYWTVMELDITTLTQVENTKLQLTKNSITDVVRILVWGALVLEFFLAMWLGAKKESTSNDDEYAEVFSSNGTSKKRTSTARN